ncbi:hypothetical protein ABZY09_46765 [Streptomyces sp. NPDC002928]|uniref:hypothetical protein n=1 Tax=Streptomyces sp. NPDC002928 TaxID=3154440 RepID=UPI0033ABF7CB
MSDETGIVGAARGHDGRLHVLDDRSGSMGANVVPGTGGQHGVVLVAALITMTIPYRKAAEHVVAVESTGETEAVEEQAGAAKS